MSAARTLVAALLAAALALAGCASSPEDDPEADLRARVRLVSAAVEARDAESARSALNGLREALETHRATGDIDPDRAEAITRAADYVEVHLDELEEPPEDEAAGEGEGDGGGGPPGGTPPGQGGEPPGRSRD